MSRFTVWLPGKGEVILTDKNHLATGGEGAVYLKDGYAYKIYLDPAKARALRAEERIRKLAAIRHPYIVAPIDVVLDTRQEVVGHYMPAAGGIPLVKTFTNAWRDQAGFGAAQAALLSENMRQAVLAAHGARALIVDGNEMNWLAEGVEPRIIDVDSWQIGPFRATAIMPSIRDPLAVEFTELSDWFAWAIVTFQVFTGIHPYKGSHPDFRKGDLTERMQARASVFDPGVKLNSAVRAFTDIPPRMLDWYARVFQGGERSAPPGVLASQVPAGGTRKARVQTTPGGGAVQHARVLSLPGDIRQVYGNGVAIYQQGEGLAAYDLMRKQPVPALSEGQIRALHQGQAALIRHGAGLLAITRVEGGVAAIAVPLPGEPVAPPAAVQVLPLQVDQLITAGNRVFAVNQLRNTLVELAASDMGGRPALAARATWPVTPLSTRFFDGVWVMDSLGMPFVAVPEGAGLRLARCPPLREYHVATGFSRGSEFVILRAIARADGQTWQLRLALAGNGYRLVDRAAVEDVDTNVAVTERGIAVSILDDGELWVASTRGDAARTVTDPGLARDMRLFVLPSGVHYWRGPDVYGLSLR